MIISYLGIQGSSVVDPNALNSNPDPEYRYWPNFDSDQDPGLPGTYLEKKKRIYF